jgi:hypothetical protein
MGSQVNCAGTGDELVLQHSCESLPNRRIGLISLMKVPVEG